MNKMELIREQDCIYKHLCSQLIFTEIICVVISRLNSNIYPNHSRVIASVIVIYDDTKGTKPEETTKSILR